MAGKEHIFKVLKNSYGPLFFRRYLDKADLGITRKYLANLDSQGLGPPGKMLVNGKVAYPTSDFFQWLAERTK